MGNRTTTTCDGAGCTAEFDNPVVSRMSPPRQHLGWALVHGLDEKTRAHFSYDLCPACVQKMIVALGLVPAEVMQREQMAAIGIFGGVFGGPVVEAPPLEPKMCETCKEPYVGESCYFCPPAAPSAEAP